MGAITLTLFPQEILHLLLCCNAVFFLIVLTPLEKQVQICDYCLSVTTCGYSHVCISSDVSV